MCAPRSKRRISADLKDLQRNFLFMSLRGNISAVLLLFLASGPACLPPASGCRAIFDGPVDGYHFSEGERIFVHTRIEGLRTQASSVGGFAELIDGYGRLLVDGIASYDSLTSYKAAINLEPSLSPGQSSHNVTLLAFRRNDDEDAREGAPCHSTSITVTLAAPAPTRVRDPGCPDCVSYRDVWATLPPPADGQAHLDPDLVEAGDPPAPGDYAWDEGGRESWSSSITPAGLSAVRELHSLARRRRHEVSVGATSTGGADSEPDFSHFLRAEGGELVLLDDLGPGCVYRILVPCIHDHVDQERAARWRLRVRIDGKLAVDLSMADWGDLGTPPFTHPLAGMLIAGQAWLSLVPMVFHRRCTVSLVPHTDSDPHEIIQDSLRCLAHGTRCSYKVYWNVDYRKGPIYATAAPFASPESSVSMELVHALRHLAVAGGDWAYGHYIPLEEAKRFSAMAVVSGPSVLWEMDGRGCILSIKFWPVGDGGSLKNLRLLVWFDGATDAQINVPMPYLFGWTMDNIGEAGHESRGMYTGHDSTGQAYITLPMPYWEGVRIAISDDHGSTGGKVDARREQDEGSEPASYVGYEIAYTDEPPCAERGDCGTLHAVFESKLVERGQDFVFIDVRQRWGTIVGVTTHIEPGSSLDDSFFYEGDFKFWIDGARAPRLDGTGTEDFYQGVHGFGEIYNFSQPLFGAPFIRFPRRKDGIATAWHNYRFLHGGDAISFHSGIRGGLEHGSTHAQVGETNDDGDVAGRDGERQMHSNLAGGRWTSVTLAYLGPEGHAAAVETDVMEVGNQTEEAAHSYRVLVDGEGCPGPGGRGGWSGWTPGAGYGHVARTMVKSRWGDQGCGGSDAEKGGKSWGRGDEACSGGRELSVDLEHGPVPTTPLESSGDGRGLGLAVEFRMSWGVSGADEGEAMLLRRRMSQVRPDQCARVCIDGAYAGSWLTAGSHAHIKEKEVDFMVHPGMLLDGAGVPKQTVLISLELAECVASLASNAWWTEMQYQTFALS